MSSVFPFLKPTFARLQNTGSALIAIGYHHIRPGQTADVHVSTLSPPALATAIDRGIVFVGMVVDGVLYDLCPAEGACPKLCADCTETTESKVPQEPEILSETEIVDVVEVDVVEVVEVDVVEVDVEEQPKPYATMYKKELLEIALERGLDADGLKKDELVELLENSDVEIL